MLEIKNKEIWVSSDFHFDHKNICRGVSEWKNPNGKIAINRTRDFKNLDDMNNTIINNINSCVGQEDVLIFLGDWSFNGFENIKKFRERIICQEIYFITGNHDHHIVKNKDDIQSIFNLVTKEEILIVDEQKIILNHYPVASWEDLRKGSIMLHGHLHSSNKEKFVGEGRIMDVGVDGHPEFRPYNLRTEILPIMKKDQ